MASEENFDPIYDEVSLAPSNDDFEYPPSDDGYSIPMDSDEEGVPDGVASRLFLNDVDSSHDGDELPMTLSDVSAGIPCCFKRKYNKINKFLHKDWKLYEKLPSDIFGPADTKKQTAVCHRVAATPMKFPVFDIVGGLNPYSWKHSLWTFLKEIIFQNMSCYPMKCRKISEEKQMLYSSSTSKVQLNKEQESVVEYIQWLKENTYNEAEGSLSSIIIQGRAGSGKTTVLQELVKIGAVSYISIGQILCSDVKRKFPYVSVHTMCAFLMCTLNVDYYTMIGLVGELLKHLSFDFLENVEINIKGKLPILTEKNSKDLFIFFIDEFSLMTDGLLGLLYKIFDYFYNTHNLNIVVIFAGDSNQINPKYQIMNSYNFGENSKIIKKINARVFSLNSQHRFNNVEYDEFLLTLNKSNNVKGIIKNYFKDQTNTIVYNYPYDVISKMPDGEDICKWFYNNINILTPPLVLGYSNRELHFNNLSLAQKIYNDLKVHTTFDNLDIGNFLKFDVPKIKIGTKEKWRTISPNFSPDEPFLVTPLIKGLPYKILSYQPNIARLSIVYLLSIHVEYISVFSMADNTILNIYPRDFQSNLFPQVTFIGFPIQLFFGETFYSSQGLTLTRDIYANLNGASKSEMYVALSRSRNISNYKSVLLQ